MGSSRRIHAAVFSFIAGVMPPMPILNSMNFETHIILQEDPARTNRWIGMIDHDWNLEIMFVGSIGDPSGYQNTGGMRPTDVIEALQHDRL